MFLKSIIRIMVDFSSVLFRGTVFFNARDRFLQQFLLACCSTNDSPVRDGKNFIYFLYCCAVTSETDICIYDCINLNLPSSLTQRNFSFFLFHLRLFSLFVIDFLSLLYIIKEFLYNHVLLFIIL